MYVHQDRSLFLFSSHLLLHIDLIIRRCRSKTWDEGSKDCDFQRSRLRFTICYRLPHLTTFPTFPSEDTCNSGSTKSRVLWISHLTHASVYLIAVWHRRNQDGQTSHITSSVCYSIYRFSNGRSLHGISFDQSLVQDANRRTPTRQERFNNITSMQLQRNNKTSPLTLTPFLFYLCVQTRSQDVYGKSRRKPVGIESADTYTMPRPSTTRKKFTLI